LLAYFTYSNLLSVSQAWVSQGRVGFQIGLIAVHGVVFIALALLLVHRQHIVPLMRRRARF